MSVIFLSLALCLPFSFSLPRHSMYPVLSGETNICYCTNERERGEENYSEYSGI